MNKNEYPLYLRVIIAKAAAGTNTMKTERVKSGRIWKIRHFSVINETNDCGLARVDIADGDVLWPLWDATPVTSNRTYNEGVDWVLREGQNLQASLTTVTLNDKISFYVHGVGEILVKGE
jgi:hypothetical protein